MSLMRRHQQAVQNGTAEALLDRKPTKSMTVIGTVPTGFMAARKLGDQLTTALAEDLKRLSALQSVERKAELKRDELIPKYAPYVQRLQAEGQQHELQGWYLVWLFDTGAMEEGLEFGFWSLAHGVRLPERFRRSVATYLADAMADWAEPLVERGDSVAPYLAQLTHAADGMCSQWDIPDELTARLLRIYAASLGNAGNWAQAVDMYEMALELGAKVKTALDKARREAAKPAPDSAE